VKIVVEIMKKILVLCTGNSCRSQMAEAYLRHFAGDKAEIFSAGVETHGLNPLAVKVMQEDGINLSGHTSDLIDQYMGTDFDYIITVCDNARERCPYFPGKSTRIHQNFPDPAKASGSEEDILNEFRRVRDMIKLYSETFIKKYLSHER